MLDFPSVLSTGRVHGRFIIAVIDGPDPGDEPDVIPAKGRIVFKASIEYTTVGEGADAVTMILAPVAGVLDDEGYLCTPHPETGEPMYRGVVLAATDDPDMSVTGWTWSADYRFEPSGTVTYKIPAHSFELPSMADRDLSTLVKVPSSPGYGLPQAEGAALRAEAAATASSDSAAQALSVAQSVRDDADAGLFDGDQGLPGNATLRVDNTVGKRVFISDGTTEHLVYADTGYRDISSLLPAGITKSVSVNASPPTIRRINSTVTIELYLDVAVSGSTTIIGLMPDAFRPRAIISRPNLLWIDTAGVGRPLPSEQFPWYLSQASIRTSGAIPANSTLLLTASWDTKAAWPTTLPGTPA